MLHCVADGVPELDCLCSCSLPHAAGRGTATGWRVQCGKVTRDPSSETFGSLPQAAWAGGVIDCYGIYLGLHTRLRTLNSRIPRHC